jgi:hypothetical protein
MPTGAGRMSVSARPSISVKEAKRMSISLSQKQGSAASTPVKMQTVEEEKPVIAQPQAAGSSVMEQRAAAMKAAQKKQPAKSKFMDSSDENEDSDSDSDDPIPPSKKPTPAPV